MRRGLLGSVGSPQGLEEGSVSPRDSHVHLGFWKQEQQLSLFTDFSFSFKTELCVIKTSKYLS